MVPSIAGPKRPQDRVILAHAKQGFREALKAYVEDEAIDGYDESVAESFPASDAPESCVRAGMRRSRTRTGSTATVDGMGRPSGEDGGEAGGWHGVRD